MPRTIALEGATVTLVKAASVNHFRFADMPITGKIEKIERPHMVGKFNRPYLIRFTDGRAGWYSRDEFRVHTSE